MVVLEEEAVAVVSKREIINAFLCMYKHSVYKLKNYSQTTQNNKTAHHLIESTKTTKPKTKC